MVYSVVDLHCDLLAYLNTDREKHRAVDDISRCSLPLLKKGGVSFQALAVFSKTWNEMQGQLECFRQISGGPRFALAIENASGLLGEKEPFDQVYARFDQEKWLYVSLTWKGENRFGGGDQSSIGLKEDGKRFLEYMDGKGVAIDLSHTSDALAEGILDRIEAKGLNILPIASHSNFRAIKNHPRNLPDAFAQEIIKRGGVIGINFVRHFVGDKPEDFVRHIEHALALGGEDALALGADFFGGIDFPGLAELEPIFQKAFEDSSCYPRFFELLTKHFGQELTEKIFYRNATARLMLEEREN
ncbi:MAG: membrane dipeptidase [Chlamydiia bacterium]|nr:membrane dipeptidase [Chlamydiia bacterium]